MSVSSFNWQGLNFDVLSPSRTSLKDIKQDEADSSRQKNDDSCVI